MIFGDVKGFRKLRVSEPFAAALVLENPDLACEYVRCMPAAEGYGVLRMYVLKRRQTEVRRSAGMK